MKKVIIAALLAAMPAITFAQQAFDKFENTDGIESVTINKKMFELLGSTSIDTGDKKAQQCLNMVKNMDNLKILTTDVRRYKKELKNAVTDYLKSNPLEELMSVNSGSSKTKIYIKQGADASLVKEVLLFVDDAGKNVVVMSFKGSVNLKDLKKLQ